MQFFLPEHYNAFTPPKPDQDGENIPARRERIRVRDRLMELDNRLWPLIAPLGWDLHQHHQREHHVSSYHFVFKDDSPIVNQITSMWLHYGKSQAQLDFLKTLGRYSSGRGTDTDEYYSAFYLHTRIQVYISADVVRLWLIFTDKNYYDKAEYLKKLKPGSLGRDTLWKLLAPIRDDGGFFYEIDGRNMPIIATTGKEAFLKFARSDRDGVYSGIVKEYQPDDPRISEENITSEMLNGMKLLYPLYLFMAYIVRGTAEQRGIA